MNRDLQKRLDRLEAKASPIQRAHFLAVEAPPGLPHDAAEAFLRAQGHRWGPDDLVFLTIYEDREPGMPMRDVTMHRTPH